MDERRRKRLVRAGIAVFAVVSLLLVIGLVVVGQLPPPVP